MSDKMRPIPFEKMIHWILEEYRNHQTIFGIHKDKFYKNTTGHAVNLFGEKLSTPLGPAAGPHSQLTQNIIAAYLTGSRFIELKTVQILDGEDLPVSKPCIAAVDECYNVEWSTELTVGDAFDEYVKAWFILHILMKELNLSTTLDFMFNMSVGYDLEGIKSKKINDFIDGLINAKTTKVWDMCQEVISRNMGLFDHFTSNDLEAISPNICKSITLSTLHGCPPQEIERIASYLLTEKKLHTFIKMNPTLLGESFVRTTLDQMGYEYITLNPHHFIHDLQYEDGVEMLKRLKDVSDQEKLEIGVKLSNTLPVKILNKELPGDEMYMSGRSLYPLTIRMAKRLASEFNGDLMISYSGGVDYFNVDKILATGIKPITFATTLLKPGGYERITQMARKIETKLNHSTRINTQLLDHLSKDALHDKYHLKELRKSKSRKLDSPLPLYDCAIAPCTKGCPIEQQIPQYIALVGEKKYDEAFSVIAIDNSAPSITGAICNHNCQTKCTRLDYDESVTIREMKKLASLEAEEGFINKIQPVEIKSDKKVAVMGAGPAGIATALFLRRNGVDVTVFDKREKPYGMVQYVIPEFRISSQDITKDFELAKQQGVNFKFGVSQYFNIAEMKKTYDYIVLALGTWKELPLSLKYGEEHTMSALTFLEKFKEDPKSVNLGAHVCIIGGGNVAMDAARAAKRHPSVKEVSIVYRRTKKYMPAHLEEIHTVLAEGIQIKELLLPISYENHQLHCEEMRLGEMKNGRQEPIPTGKMTILDADTVIVAIGETVEEGPLVKNNLLLNEKNYPIVNSHNETNLRNVYCAGDMKKGPQTIVSAILDGKIIARDILQKEGITPDFEKVKVSFDDHKTYEKKGLLSDILKDDEEAKRCLSCHHVCELCVDVCPNRANVKINVGSTHQIVHIDTLCNECGNCGVFCPHTGNPYKDKITVFSCLEDFENSENTGFLKIKEDLFKIRLENGDIIEHTLGEENISKDLSSLIESVVNDYGFIL